MLPPRRRRFWLFLINVASPYERTAKAVMLASPTLFHRQFRWLDPGGPNVERAVRMSCCRRVRDVIDLT